jgi:SAM-dependent methyltransferase
MQRVGVKIYQRRTAQARNYQRRHGMRRIVVAALLVCGLSAGRAATAQVPFVPTPPEVVEKMLSMAKVTKSDYVIDLGSGDGRVVRMAAQKFGARGFGVDLDAELVARSTNLARRDGVADRVNFFAQDLFKTDISEATVLTMYLLPAVNMKLRPRLLSELKPGTRIVSHDFDLGDWHADETATLYAKEKYAGAGGDSTVYLWIVPADAAGHWRWRLRFAGREIDYELVLTQQFQKVQGVVRAAGREAKIEAAELRGATLRFASVIDVNASPVRHVFSGRVVGDTIEGDVTLTGARIQGAQQWTGARVVRGATHINLNQTASAAANPR